MSEVGRDVPRPVSTALDERTAIVVLSQAMHSVVCEASLNSSEMDDAISERVSSLKNRFSRCCSVMILRNGLGSSKISPIGSWFSYFNNNKLLFIYFRLQLKMKILGTHLGKAQ